MDDIIKLSQLIRAVAENLPDGTNVSLEKEEDGWHKSYACTKCNGEMNITTSCKKINTNEDEEDNETYCEFVPDETTFDDSETKELANDFMEAAQDIDDDLFVEILEKLKDVVDINELSDLLEKKSFTEDEADQLEAGIIKASIVIKKALREKIEKLTCVAEKF